MCGTVQDEAKVSPIYAPLLDLPHIVNASEPRGYYGMTAYFGGLGTNRMPYRFLDRQPPTFSVAMELI